MLFTILNYNVLKLNVSYSIYYIVIYVFGFIAKFIVPYHILLHLIVLSDIILLLSLLPPSRQLAMEPLL